MFSSVSEIVTLSASTPSSSYCMILKVEVIDRFIRLKVMDCPTKSGSLPQFLFVFIVLRLHDTSKHNTMANTFICFITI